MKNPTSTTVEDYEGIDRGIDRETTAEERRFLYSQMFRKTLEEEGVCKDTFD